MMKSTSVMQVGDIVCPLPRTFNVVGENVLLPGGEKIRHNDTFNVTIISHFLVAVKPIAVDEEIVLNLNLAFYDMIKTPDTISSFENPAASGFRYLTEEEKQQLYLFADEDVRQAAITDGFVPKGKEGGINVKRTKHDTLAAVSSRDHPAGAVVFTATGVLLPFPVRSTIEVPGDRHLRLTGGSQFLLHSCLPNLRLEIVGNEIRGVALRPIEEGERLTYNYLCTEWEVSKVFHCSCNKYCCYGLIRGFRVLEREQQEHLLPQCSAAVQEKFHAYAATTAVTQGGGATLPSITAAGDTAALSTAGATGDLVAQRYIQAGTVLLTASHPARVEVDTQTAVCSERGLSSRCLVIGSVRLPHACDANTALVEGRLVSTRPLLSGDVLTFNLNLLAHHYPGGPWPCTCGCTDCPGTVEGFGSLTHAAREALWHLASPEARAGALAAGHALGCCCPSVEVRETAVMGHTTYATAPIATSTRIFHMKGLVLPFPTVYTIYLGEDRHLLFAGGAQCLAHCCNPNTRIVTNPVSGSFDCIALRNIAADEVVSFNYLTTEWDMDSPFRCACGGAKGSEGQSSCFKCIAGFRHLSRQDQLRLWPSATQAIRSLFAHSSNTAVESVLARLDADLVAPEGSRGELCIQRDLPSGTVILTTPQRHQLREGGRAIVLGDVTVWHECEASAVLLEGRLVLCRAATAGTRVTINVCQLAYRLEGTGFECDCGAATCIKTVGGFSELTESQQDALLLCTAPDVRAEAVSTVAGGAGYKNKSCCHMVEVKANGSMGQATFAAQCIPAGTRFFRVTGLVLSFPTVYTILLEPGRHLLFAGGAQCLAHSCEPNVRVIVDAESRAIDCLALRDITPGEVISFNYLTTEWDMSAPFKCVCGSARCFGKISGFKHLSNWSRQLLWQQAAPGIRLLAHEDVNRNNWRRLASPQLRTDNQGHVLAARELHEGQPVLDAVRVELLRDDDLLTNATAVLVDGVRLRHSCRPTAAIIENHVVLVQTVCSGEEISVDVNCLRYKLDTPFTCTCVAQPQGHIVSGFVGLSNELKAARVIYTDPSVRAAALRDGFKVPCPSPVVGVRANGEMGQATFAKTGISAGTRFLRVKGLSIPFPTVYTIMLTERRHLLFADGAQCLAHSCDPNVLICVDAVNNTLECEALRDIAAGELIAFNYNTTEWDMSAPFRCLCGGAECAFEIRGFKHLSRDQREKLQPYTTPAIRELAGASTEVHLPSHLLREDIAGYLYSVCAISSETIVMELFYMDVQPNQLCVGKNYTIAHSSTSNCVLVEGRIVACADIAPGERLTINMNYFVYDMAKLFRSGLADDCRGFKYMDESLKQRQLYLCEPAVRAQAMRDGWIVKSTQDALTVRPNGDMGQTAYATCDIPVGTRLFHCTGLVVPFPTMYTICVGDRKHLLFGDAAECIAHHCDPNVRVIVNDDGASFDFVTIKPVQIGEMVTFNYCTTEWHMNTPFVCLCGSPVCAHTIQGFKHLNDAQRQRLWPITSDVVKQYCNAEQ